MDDRLDKALQVANLMITFNNQKRSLKEKYYLDCIFYFNGGIFTLNPSLISYVKSLRDTGYILDVVLLDDNQIPIMVENLEIFQQLITEKYSEATNSYYFEFEKLKKNRSVESLTL